MKSSQETCYIGIGIFGREKNRHFVLFPLPFLVEKYFILIVHDSDRSCSVLNSGGILRNLLFACIIRGGDLCTN